MPGSMHFARRFWREERQGSPEAVGRQQLSSPSPFAGITRTGSTGVISARTEGTPARPNVFQVNSLRSRYLDHLDAVLMEQPALVTRRRRLIPLVEQRQRLADSLARLLGQLGLERRTEPVNASVNA